MCGECGCQCGCEAGIPGYPHGRRFLTKEEKIERLENYAESLKKELSAVAEKIKELKN
jgi:hypothetical protein